MRYEISLWNFNHYNNHNYQTRDLLAHCAELGYGVEAWWHSPRTVRRCRLEGISTVSSQIKELAQSGEFQSIMKGLPVSLHTGKPEGWDEHKLQIDDAALLGAETIVLHSRDLADENDAQQVDVELGKKVLDYAQRHNITIALENGPYDYLKNAIEKLPDLSVCLDVGHVYNQGDSMRDYLDAFKDRIAHFHLQDIRRPEESEIPLVPKDHFTPGTGGIPEDDWQLIADTTSEINFQGVFVFEIRPRNPFQTALSGQHFWEGLFR